MADEDMREMVDAIQEAYLIAKKNNKKYTPKSIAKTSNLSLCVVRFMGQQMVYKKWIIYLL